jgi:hypothetical protein
LLKKLLRLLKKLRLLTLLPPTLLPLRPLAKLMPPLLLLRPKLRLLLPPSNRRSTAST